MNVRAEIESANERFVDAFAAGDAQRLASYYTSDGQALPPGGDVVSGHSAITGMWQAVMAMGVKRAELETVEVDEVADSTAIEQGRYRLFGEGNAPIDHGKYLVVWRREGDGWKLHRDIWNTSTSA